MVIGFALMFFVLRIPHPTGMTGWIAISGRLLFVYELILETKGRALEEIQADWQHKRAARSEVEAA